MFPGVHGFHWDPAQFIFLGIFFTVVLVVFGAWLLGLVRSAAALKKDDREKRLWKLEFPNLPAEERKCRHALTGELEGRLCPRAFTCGGCETHASLSGGDGASASVAGGQYPGTSDDFLYHRGHTWVRPEEDGAVSIGLDNLASQLIGIPDSLELPEPGARVHNNGAGWTITKKGVKVRILSPVDGEVVELGGTEDDWVMKVRPDCSPEEMTHLLGPSEASAWLTRELERLQTQVAAPDLGSALADGGTLIEDVSGEYSRADWDRICSSFFLQS